MRRRGETLGLKNGGWIGGIIGAALMWLADAPHWAAVGVGFLAMLQGCVMQAIDEMRAPPAGE